MKPTRWNMVRYLALTAWRYIARDYIDDALLAATIAATIIAYLVATAPY